MILARETGLLSNKEGTDPNIQCAQVTGESMTGQGGTWTTRQPMHLEEGVISLGSVPLLPFDVTRSCFVFKENL